MKMPKNVDLSKSINREKVIEPSIANNEKNIGCPPLVNLVKAFTVSFFFLAKLTQLKRKTLISFLKNNFHVCVQIGCVKLLAITITGRRKKDNIFYFICYFDLLLLLLDLNALQNRPSGVQVEQIPQTFKETVSCDFFCINNFFLDLEDIPF